MKNERLEKIPMKKQVTIRSSAAEYLTYIAATGDSKETD